MWSKEMFPPQTLRSIKNQRGLEGVEAILLISVTGICVALVLPDFNHILNYLNENKSFGDALSLRASELSYAFIGVKTLAALALVLIAGYLIYFILDFIVEFLRVLYRKVKPDPTDVCAKAWNAFYRHDYEKAFPLFKSLAEQGNSSAQCGLGLMHENGFVTPENFEEAIRLYRLAANIGEARGQYLLACMYEMGQGVDQNYQEAVKWLMLASEQGDTEAQNALGKMYKNGRGVERDYVLAYKWLYVSVSRGGETYGIEEDFDFLSSKMTPSQIEEAKKMVEEWQASWAD